MQSMTRADMGTLAVLLVLVAGSVLQAEPKPTVLETLSNLS